MNARSVGLIAVLLACAAAAQPAEDETPPPFKMTPKQAAEYVKATRAALLDSLKDAGSAQLRGQFLSQGRLFVQGKLTHPIYVCGEVNARNSYGGYAGFRRFIANPEGAHIEPERNDPLFSEISWGRQCVNKLRDL